ncbi:hypothetical protein SO3561_04519 [Streptomyces olivochromogenes]|uniref:Uncharacterized protein n=2 Tax=Streptomyces olivochromogenes TaxID=1963 RepID=A0A250VFY7_STROL|nr:hypothetical protein SO3561_04519 [Streptomyces olivochromogenes]
MVNRDEDSEPLDYPEPVPRPGLPSDPGESPHGTSGDSLPSLQEIQRFLS